MMLRKARKSYNMMFLKVLCVSTLEKHTYKAKTSTRMAHGPIWRHCTCLPSHIR